MATRIVIHERGRGKRPSYSASIQRGFLCFWRTTKTTAPHATLAQLLITVGRSYTALTTSAPRADRRRAARVFAKMLS